MNETFHFSSANHQHLTISFIYSRIIYLCCQVTPSEHFMKYFPIVKFTIQWVSSVDNINFIISHNEIHRIYNESETIHLSQFSRNCIENNIENIWVVDTKKDCLKVSNFVIFVAVYNYSYSFRIILLSEFSNNDVEKEQIWPIIFNIIQLFIITHV